MHPRLLFIGYIWPEPQSSAAGLRAMSLLRIFLEAGWEVHFASPANADKAMQDDQHAARLRSLGVHTRAIAPNDSAFDAWISELKPETVIFDRFMMEEQFGWRVREQCPDALLVLDTVDLHFLRRARQEAIHPTSPGGNLTLKSPLTGVSAAVSELAYREIAAIYRCDCSLLISEFERGLLCDPQGDFRVPAEILREFSFCYDPAPATSTPPERTGFAVIGNFRHEPNADGVRWLKREIWPLIRKKLPHAQIDVFGAYPPREIMQLTDKAQGFVVRGPAVDQYETLGRYRVGLAPLRFGAGLKGKISDSWWCAMPVVTTSVGAEGMTLQGKFGGLIADAPEDFAQAAVELHENPAAHRRAREVGFEILAAKFDHRRNAQALLKDLAEIRGRLAGHRFSNFTGRMLSHHLHRSTKYFSRWIELKKQPRQT